MDIFQRLIKVFQVTFDDTVDVSGVSPELSLREDLGINSIGLLYMAMAVEEEFEVKFKNEDFAAIRTVADVIACIESKK